MLRRAAFVLAVVAVASLGGATPAVIPVKMPSGQVLQAEVMVEDADRARGLMFQRTQRTERNRTNNDTAGPRGTQRAQRSTENTENTENTEKQNEQRQAYVEHQTIQSSTEEQTTLSRAGSSLTPSVVPL
jgi:hypothetical protein